MVLSPLTLKETSRLVDMVPSKLLIDRYASLFGIDTSDLFEGIDSLGVYRCDESDFVFFDPPVCGDGPFYEALQRNDWYYQEEKNEFEIARPYFPEGSRVLEVGCGGGAFLSSLTGTVTRGIEYNDRAIAKARSRGLQVDKTTLGDLLEAGEWFDVVCSFQVLEHVKEPRSFLEECRALTRPGGLIVVGVPNLRSFAAMPSLHQILNVPPHHVSWWSPKTFAWLGNQPGWRLVQCIEEDLQNEHVLACAETALFNRLSRRARKKVVSLPGSRQPIRIVARLLAPLLARCLGDERLRPRGQALVAVLENRG